MAGFKLFNSKSDKEEKKNKKDKTKQKVKTSKFSLNSPFKKSSGKMPTKTTINLAIKGEKSVSVKRLLPGIILLVLFLVIFGKFMVIDRLMAALNASNEVTTLQGQLDAAYAKLREYENIEDEYAHYTYSGMTEEELGLVDRVEVMRLVEQVLSTGDAAKSWSLSENILTIQMSGASLAELNELSRSIDKSTIVDHSMITTANKPNNINMKTDVTATITVYLKKDQDEADNTAAADTTSTQETGEGINQ